VGARRMQLGRSAFGRYRQLKLLVSRHPRGTDATKCGLDVWLCTAATTSAGVGLSAVNRSGSSRSRSG
jgi:hypothetical protein